MKKRIAKLVYWTPRILSIIFILFLSLMSFDIFDGNYGFWETILGLFMHNIPTLILLVILLISWKHEIVGGIGFVLGGIAYVTLLTITSIKSGFKWYYLAWAIQISGIAFFIGILFLVGWYERKKSLQKKTSNKS